MFTWLVVSTPLKNMKVSWDDEIPNIWKIKNVPNHQPVNIECTSYAPLVFKQESAMVCHGHLSTQAWLYDSFLQNVCSEKALPTHTSTVYKKLQPLTSLFTSVQEAAMNFVPQVLYIYVYIYICICNRVVFPLPQLERKKQVKHLQNHHLNGHYLNWIGVSTKTRPM